MRSNRRMAALTGLLFLLSASAHAEIYRWVDEDGVVNYTQHKPEGRKSSAVVTRGNLVHQREAPKEAEPDQPKLTADQQAALERLKASEAQRQKEIADIRQANCEKSQSVLQRLTASNRIRVRAANGEETVMGEDERQRRIDEAQRGVATNCEEV